VGFLASFNTGLFQIKNKLNGLFFILGFNNKYNYNSKVKRFNLNNLEKIMHHCIVLYKKHQAAKSHLPHDGFISI